MEKNYIMNKLNEIFRDIFDDEGIELSEDTTIELGEDTTARNIDGWDSLTHVNIVVAIEREFNIEFSTDEVKNMNNIGSMIEVIAKKI